MLHKLYRLWIVLMIVSGGVALTFLGFALADLCKFINLNTYVPAHVHTLSVKALSSSHYVVEVQYSYEAKGSVYQGKNTLGKTFLNSFAAEKQVKALTAKDPSWQVWYMSRNPSLSSLERDPPYKSCLTALLTIGVFLYFYFARGLLLKFIQPSV